jgi:hypothetical protein
MRRCCKYVSGRKSLERPFQTTNNKPSHCRVLGLSDSNRINDACFSGIHQSDYRVCQGIQTKISCSLEMQFQGMRSLALDSSTLGTIDSELVRSMRE